MAFCDSHFGQRVSTLCHQHYNSLGKKGKPERGREWTKMACILRSTEDGDNLEIISMATGTKCIGATVRCSNGGVVNDSHAEVLARRLFLKYLYSQLKVVQQQQQQQEQMNMTGSTEGSGCIFVISDSSCPDVVKFRLKEGVCFHMYTTDTPCGDASIFPKTQPADKPVVIKSKSECDVVSENVETGRKRKIVEPLEGTEKRKTCRMDDDLITKETPSRKTDVRTNVVVEDIHRTGAKCVVSGKQDGLNAGALYHETGVLRIKPGRGERTLSMSCSDKIMRWCVLGINGGLLANFLDEPIFLTSLIVGGDKFHHPSMSRALSLRGRVDKTCALTVHTPKILHVKDRFVDGVDAIDVLDNPQEGSRRTPCGGSIMWCRSPLIHEVSVKGRKHGINKKNFNSPKANVSVCKKVLFQDYGSLLDSLSESQAVGPPKTYQKCKHADEKYRMMRNNFFEVFADWSKKPVDEEEFTLS